MKKISFTIKGKDILQQSRYGHIQKNRVLVVEDKRFKKEKYKKNYLDEC